MCFNQLLGAHSTQKLVEIHNSLDLKLLKVLFKWFRLLIAHNSD